MNVIKSGLEFLRASGTCVPGQLRCRLRSVPGRMAARAIRVSVVMLAVSAVLATGAVIAAGRASSQAKSLQASLQVVRQEVAAAKSEGALLVMQLERLKAVHDYSGRYGIPADLAASIYETGLAYGLAPDVAFRLVKTESSFRARAVSSTGALGYTQIKPSTAMWLDPDVRAEDLFDRDTNLRLGFEYLSVMLTKYDQDMRLALLAYNRGPARVRQLLARGDDPANGYAQVIMETLD